MEHVPEHAAPTFRRRRGRVGQRQLRQAGPGLGQQPPQPIRAHRITAPWDEATVTWRRFAERYAPEVEATTTGIPYGTSALDLTALVQAWVDGAHPNHGVLLEEDAGARTAFRSSEHHVASQRPRLDVCYMPR